MLKRIALLVALGLLAATIFSAAPSTNNWANKVADTMTVDSQYSGGSWELVDSIIVIKDDTCYTLYTIEGTALLGYNDKLYVGFIDGGGDPTANPGDTLIVRSPAVQSIDLAYVSFKFTYLDSLVSQTPANDTIYFVLAVGGSAASEKVMVEDIILTATVLDFSAAGVVGE